jgi:hypothetical protein
MVQHKWVVAEEALPEKEEFVRAYTNPQLPSTLVYKGYMDNNPDKPNPPPAAVQRPPAPPEIANTVGITDQLIQNILGSYDASLGINNNQLSGVAIVEAATQSNAAAMPYVVGFMQALNQIAQIILDLIPKYYITPRTIPVMQASGMKSYQIINQPGGVDVNYDENALNVSVEAGVSFSIQKSKALQQMIALMQASPLFAQFINSVGMEELLDNLEIKGIDQLKAKVQGFMQQMQQQQQQAMQMQQQQMMNNPQMMRAQNEKLKMVLDAKQNQVENQIKASNLQLTEEQIENERIKMLAEMEANARDRAVQLDKHQTEKDRMAVDLAMQAADMQHRHLKERHELGQDHMETQRKIADTILTHKAHERSESTKKESMEHD